MRPWAPLLLLLGLVACSSDSSDYVVAAQKYQATGDYPAAVIALKNSLRKDPQNARARLVLSEVYLALGEADNAQAQLKRAHELGVDPATTMLLQIDLALALNQPGEALEILATAVQTDDSPALKLREAEIYFMLDEPDKAQALFESLSERSTELEPKLGFIRSALANNNLQVALNSIDRGLVAHPDAGQLYALKGSAQMLAGNSEAAAEALLRAIKLLRADAISTDYIDALAELANVRLKSGQLPEAKVRLLELQELAPADPRILFLASHLAFAEGRYADAIAKLHSVLRAQPDNTSALMLSAQANFAQGNLYQAESSLKRLLLLDRRNLFASLLMANIQIAEGRAEAALAGLEPLGENNGHSAAYFVGLGQARAASGQAENALADFRRAIELDPESVPARLELAATYLGLGEKQKANQVLKALANVSSADQRLLRLLSIADIDTKDKVGSTVRLAQLLADNPTDGEIHRIAAGLFLSFSATDKARETLKAAEKFEPNSTATLMALAGVEISASNLTAAEVALNRVVELSPRHTVAMTALAKIAVGDNRRVDAIRWLERARESSSDAIDARLMLAELYADDDKLIRAQTIISETLELHKDVPEVARKAAIVLRAIGLQEEAERVLRHAARLAADDAGKSVAIGRTMTQFGLDADARPMFQLALEQAPKNTIARMNLFGLALRNREFSAAAAIINELRVENSDDALLEIMSADLQIVENKTDAARTSLNQALSHGAGAQAIVRLYQLNRIEGASEPEKILKEWLIAHPEDPTIVEVMAQHYQMTGELGKAREYYERTVRIAPGNAMALNNLAWLYMSQDDQRDLPTARAAYRASPGDPSIADTLGWILLKRGEAEKAVEFLRIANKRSRGNGEIRYHLAAALEKAGDKNEAQQLLEQLLSSPVTFTSRSEAQSLLQKLRVTT